MAKPKKKADTSATSPPEAPAAKSASRRGSRAVLDADEIVACAELDVAGDAAALAEDEGVVTIAEDRHRRRYGRD